MPQEQVIGKSTGHGSDGKLRWPSVLPDHEAYEPEVSPEGVLYVLDGQGSGTGGAGSHRPPGMGASEHELDSDVGGDEIVCNHQEETAGLLEEEGDFDGRTGLLGCMIGRLDRAVSGNVPNAERKSHMPEHLLRTKV